MGRPAPQAPLHGNWRDGGCVGGTAAIGTCCWLYFSTKKQLLISDSAAGGGQGGRRSSCWRGQPQGWGGVSQTAPPPQRGPGCFGGTGVQAKVGLVGTGAGRTPLPCSCCRGPSTQPVGGLRLSREEYGCTWGACGSLGHSGHAALCKPGSFQLLGTKAPAITSHF